MASSSKLNWSSDGVIEYGLSNEEDDGMTDEDCRVYYRAEAESEGFDVPLFPKSEYLGMIIPISDLNGRMKEIQPLGELAIKHYNEKNGAKFEITEYVRVNCAAAAGLIYYMTFKAKPNGTSVDHPTTTFQARIFDGIEDIEVYFCRISQWKYDP